ncbi:serine hydrolase domain-containing protein [Streptomyces griseoviridis]
MAPVVSSSNRRSWSRRLRRTSALVWVPVVALVTCTACAGTGQTVSTAPSAPARLTVDRAQHDALARLAQELVDAGAPGVTVRVDDGRSRPVEVVRQAPWAKRVHRLTQDDEFRMGSNTKTMMATLVLMLAADGDLSLDDPVEKWLPGKVPGGDRITLRMLLNHTSGLYDYTGDPELLDSILGKSQRRWTSAQLLAVAARHDVLFPPGTRWSYSNTDYIAIGSVLERVTGSTPAALIRDRIARPLGLDHTYYATDASWRGPYARGYEPDAAHMPSDVPDAFKDVAGNPVQGHVDVSGNDVSWGGAAGAVVSNTRDWSRFYTALMSGKLLPAAQVEELRRTVPMDPDNPEKGPASGLGIETGSTPCGTIWAHDGGMTGYSSTNYTDVKGSRTASVLVSTDFAFEFAADPKMVAANEALQTAAICAMFGKQAPTQTD